MEEVLAPENVEDSADLKKYFRQRLGGDFDDLPMVLVERDAYLDLIHGEKALLGKMIAEQTEAANEIFVAFAGDKKNRVLMTFNIESQDVGKRAIDFIRSHRSSPEHDEWLTEMEQLSLKMQQLHRTWKRREREFVPMEESRPNRLPKVASSVDEDDE